MALLTTIKLVEAQGSTITTTTATAGGDTFTYSNNTMLYVTNSSGASVDVTISVVDTTSFLPGTGNLTKSDIVISVADSTVAILDCRSPAYRNSTGLVSVSYSTETNITLAPFEIDRI